MRKWTHVFSLKYFSQENSAQLSVLVVLSAPKLYVTEPYTKCRQIQVSDVLFSWQNCSFFSLSPAYAQLKMEYCEKSTLRDTIDEGLFEDTSRLWRLFREILDGLAYIHEKVSKYDSYDLSIVYMLCLFLYGLLYILFILECLFLHNCVY